MIPTDIGLPRKFTRFRPGQLESACNAAASEKRFIMIPMPTGGGKSVVNMAVDLMLDQPGVILTANKGLQEQYSADMASIGLVDVRGQANYPCVKLKSRPGYWGCDKGPCHFGRDCELHPYHEAYQPGCGFYDALRRFRNAKFGVTNYDMWMSANRFMDPGALGVRKILNLDEAHNGPEKLAEFCSVKLTEDECREFLSCGLPPVEDGSDAWADWAEFYFKPTADKYDDAKQRGDEDPDYMKRFRDVVDKLGMLAGARQWEQSETGDPDVKFAGRNNDWVAERLDRELITFDPVWPHRYAERWLFAGVPKVILTSATILPQTARYLGIPPDQLEIQEAGLGFLAARRPIYVLPAAYINYESTAADYRALVTKIDQFIGMRSDRKGIIPVHSYRLAETIYNMSRWQSRFITHTKFNTRAKIEEFRRAGPGHVLISPAIAEGYDFPYEQCEFCIIPKIPFIPHQSMVVKARARSDKTYLNYLALLSLIQRTGRGMRAMDDQCEIVIFDANAKWFLSATKAMQPKYFKDALRWTGSLPQPLEALHGRRGAISR